MIKCVILCCRLPAGLLWRCCATTWSIRSSPGRFTAVCDPLPFPLASLKGEFPCFLKPRPCIYMFLCVNDSYLEKKVFGICPVIRLSWQPRQACDIICSQPWPSDLRLQVFVFAPDGMRLLFWVFHRNCSNGARHLESRIESRSRRSLQFQLLPHCQPEVWKQTLSGRSSW